MSHSPSRGFFASLHAWAWRQDENFITELLAGFLREALLHDPVHAAQFLRWLAPSCDWSLLDPAVITVRTQIRSLQSVPDIQILAPHMRVDVECKVESPVDQDQLSRHLSGLPPESEATGGLVLVTRYPVVFEARETLVAHRRWFEIAEQLNSIGWSTPVTAWLSENVVRFLEERGMVAKRIEEGLVPGLGSLQNLLAMVDETMRMLGIRVRVGTNQSEIGRGGPGAPVYPRLKEVGVYIQLARPGVVHVQVREVDPKAYGENPGPGRLNDWNWWVVPLDLVAEGFFAPECDVDHQQAFLSRRIKEIFDFGAKIAPPA